MSLCEENQDKIIRACAKGNFRYAVELSKNLRSDEFSAVVSKRGWTPLHYACSFCRVKYASTLNSLGYDPRQKDSTGVTPLHLACQYGPLEMVQLLINNLTALDYNIETECVDSDMNTPVHSACQYGQLDTMKTLLRYVNEAVVMQKNRDGDTPLGIAFQQGEVGIVMLFARIIPSAKIKQHITREEGTVLFHKACEYGRVEAVDFLLKNGFRLHQVMEMYKRSAVHVASTYGQMEVLAVLVQYGCQPSTLTDYEGSTPLHVACWHGHLNVVQRLICRHSCNPLEENSKGETPFSLACISHHYSIARYIQHWLASQGDVPEDIAAASWPKVDELPSVSEPYRSEDDIVLLTLQAVERTSVPLSYQQQLHMACQRGVLDVVKLLSESNIDPLLPITEEGHSALHVACEYGQSDIARYLIDTHGCDPTSKTKNGSTAFHCANNPAPNAAHNPLDIGVLFEKYFKEHHGNTGTYHTGTDDEPDIHEKRRENIQHLKYFQTLDLDSKNDEGKTALHYACRHGLKDNLRQLLSMGCNPFIRDKECNTAMHLACLSGNAETISTLSSYSSKLCNPRCKNSYLDTPLHFAASTGNMELATSSLRLFQKNVWYRPIPQNCVWDTPLHEACRSGSVDFVRYLVEEMKYKVRVRNKSGETPLHSACCKSGNVQVVKYLVTKMGNPLVKNKVGDSPLHNACAFGQYEIVKFLISHLAEAKLKKLHNNQGFNPLHTACSFGQDIIVKYLLQCSIWDPNKPDCAGRTPLHCIFQGLELEYCSHAAAQETLEQLLTKKSLNLSLLDHNGQTPFAMCNSTKLEKILLHNMKNSAEMYVKYCGQLQPQSLPASSLVVFVLGNRGVGKSSLIASLQKEKKLSLSQKVTVVSPCTAGIVPSKFFSKAYGSVMFYDFAGHYEYYAGHSAILQNCATSKIPPLFLVVVNLEESSDDIRKRLGYWLYFLTSQYHMQEAQSHVVIIGSHSDKISAQDATSKKECIHYIIQHHGKQFQYQGCVLLDCRRPDKMDCLRSKLSVIDRDRIGRIDPMAQYFLSFLESNLQHSEVALTVTELETRVKESSWFKVPEKFENDPSITPFEPHHDTLEVCRHLNEHGHILLLEQEEKSCSWVVFHTQKLLSDIMGSIFVPTDPQSSPSCTGVVTFSAIKAHIAIVDTEVIVKFLCHFQFCRELSDCQVLDLLVLESRHEAISTIPGERYFFFPGLINTVTPDTLWEEDEQYTFYSGWMLECIELEYMQFLTSRFLQVLQLRLMFGFAFPSTTAVSPLPDPALRRKCVVWKNGIQWKEHGTQVLVEVTEQNTKVVVLLRSYQDSKSKNITLRSSIIREVLEAKNEFCCHTCISQSFLHPQDIKQYPLQQNVRKFNIHDVAQAIVHPHNKAKYVLDNMGSCEIQLNELLYFEPYAELCRMILCQLLNDAASDVEIPHHILEGIAAHCSASERGELFADILGYHSATKDEIATVFRHWKNRGSCTFESLKASIDQYTVFRGRAGRQLLLDETEHHLSRFPGASSVCLRCQEPEIPLNNEQIDDTHLEEDNLFEVLSELVEVVQWKNFSLALGLLPSTVNKIAAKERGDVDNCLREALLAWLCWQDNTRATTWRELYQALRQCGCVSVAKQVARNHPQHPAAIPNSSPP